uniref:uncharacterized protein LOC122606337 isoform X2 n=1 Tax=Erigeron canadensis TaxID=72917 RepID=UPI001CB8C8F6|nr:uncharacterized protein LOC122606337 isoform X2 [Erigeron canadensis]
METRSSRKKSLAPVAMESAGSSDNALKRGLVNFDKVIKVRFLHRMDYTYTRACILVMESRDAAKKIVKKWEKSPVHFKNNIEVKLEMYSETLHELVKEKGRYKAWAKLKSKPGEAYQVYEKLEYLLQSCSPTDYRIYKMKGKCTGHVKLRFKTQDDKDKAVEIFEMTGSEWKFRG